jgi:hypothetical protein
LNRLSRFKNKIFPSKSQDQITTFLMEQIDESKLNDYSLDMINLILDKVAEIKQMPEGKAKTRELQKIEREEIEFYRYLFGDNLDNVLHLFGIDQSGDKDGSPL